jgi:Glutamate dehydrogenase/leucine dehydrogenase
LELRKNAIPLQPIISKHISFNQINKSKKIMNAAKVVESLKQRFPNEPEYIQAVSQVLGTIEEEYNKHPEFEKANLIERLCIPDRLVEFRVTWTDDKGNVQTNMGYRIQHNNVIGRTKGGIRFHALRQPLHS